MLESQKGNSRVRPPKKSSLSLAMAVAVACERGVGGREPDVYIVYILIYILCVCVYNVSRLCIVCEFIYCVSIMYCILCLYYVSMYIFVSILCIYYVYIMCSLNRLYKAMLALHYN